MPIQTTSRIPVANSQPKVEDADDVGGALAGAGVVVVAAAGLDVLVVGAVGDGGDTGDVFVVGAGAVGAVTVVELLGGSLFLAHPGK